ncbi:autotransporter outer membrane beta-barrel domain-containing protein [Ochrobactrum pseudogrignonense]|nr:autotransporter outer membrane beta-barrel domain-containing protein [Brucella pseudogrignonensis]
MLNSKLGDDGSETDRLIFEGNVSGTSSVSVNNAGGLGALTLGDGIMIVDAAKASNDAFVQQGRIAAGAYDYTLFAEDRSGNFDGKWYLRSSYNPAPTPDPDPDPNPEPDPNPNPGPKPEPELPNYRPEVPLDMVAPFSQTVLDWRCSVPTTTGVTRLIQSFQPSGCAALANTVTRGRPPAMHRAI